MHSTSGTFSGVKTAEGGQGRQGLVTAYRQDALKLALFLYEAGASRGADAARETGVEHATRMMRDNHYGWFEKVDRGIYGLTPVGAKALDTHAETVKSMMGA